jgi:hypothetical protein
MRRQYASKLIVTTRATTIYVTAIIVIYVTATIVIRRKRGRALRIFFNTFSYSQIF